MGHGGPQGAEVDDGEGESGGGGELGALESHGEAGPELDDLGDPLPSLDALPDVDVSDLLEEAPAEGRVELFFAAEEEEGERAFDVVHGGFHGLWGF